MKPNRNTFFLTFVLATALSLTAAWTCAAAVPDPTPTDLGVLQIYGHNFSQANAINANGQVVGESYEADTPYPKPFIWQNEVMTPLPLPSGSERGFATVVNASGQVAGTCETTEGWQAYVWTPKGSGWEVTELGAPTYKYPEDQDVSLTFTSSYACKINDAGQVLALAHETTSDLTVAAIWQSNAWTVLTKSDGILGGISRLPCKMNETGQVLLEVENPVEEWSDLWLWDNGKAILIVKRIDWANLNNSGQVVGMYYDTDQNYNFTYEISTKAFKFSPISEAGYSLVNINDSGQVVVAYPTKYQSESGYWTELGVTSFEDWSPGASVTSLGSVNGYVDNVSLNFNVNGEVSSDGYSNGSAFYASATAGVVPLFDLVEDSELQVTAMNDSGVIIGSSGGHAVLWGEVGPSESNLDIFILPSGPVPVNTQITSGAYLSDPQTTDIHTATWDWGDMGTSDGTIDEENTIVTGEHSYAEPGVYTVGLKIFKSDEDLLNQAVYQYVVVYDPTAGFVTGGGWINSPAGAYKDDPSLEGQATFGFVSRYKKGTTVPTGNTAFEFAAGDLHFQSTSYDWLVVKGSDQASFKGSGTINGLGDYKFMLWAGDGAPDTFRIRIWDEVEETAEEIDIYDNEFDQAIGGGSIVIHVK